MRAVRRLWIGLAALAAVLLIGLAATLLTARPGDPALFPVAEGEGIAVYVVSNGYHSGLVLPRDPVASAAGTAGLPALISVGARFRDYEWVEVGWGDEAFYRDVPEIDALNWRLALRALFRPGNASVLHVVGVQDTPRATFPSADMVRIDLSPGGFDRLLAKLDASFARGDGGRPVDLGPGLYGPSLFYRAVGAFSLLNLCNHWTAGLLDAAGLPTAPVPATLPVGLILDLKWRAGLAPMPQGADERQPPDLSDNSRSDSD